MKKFFTLFAIASCLGLCTVAAQADVVTIYSDSNPGDGGPTAIVNATLASGGLMRDLTAKFSNVNTGAVALPALTDRTGPISFSIDYTVPTNTGLNLGDLLYVQLNFDGVNSGSAGFVNAGTVADGVQRNITLTEANFNGVGAANFLTASNALVQFIIADNGFGAGTDFVSPNPAVFVDNLAFTVTTTAVPEPSSLAVLGLSSLAMLRRRRR